MATRGNEHVSTSNEMERNQNIYDILPVGVYSVVIGESVASSLVVAIMLSTVLVKEIHFLERLTK